MRRIPTVTELFDLSHTICSRLLEASHYGHRAISELKDYIKCLIPTLGKDYEEISEGVFAAKKVSIDKSAVLLSPTIICEGAEIRSGAFIRGSAVIGKGAVIGNSTEVKNSIVFDEAKLPHYNYVGDSIIGYKAHLGAGAIASNQRLDKKSVRLIATEETIDTGMKKLGVMLGDYAEVGCNSVLSPGTIIGKEGMIYPLSHVRGIVNERQIFGKSKKESDRE